MCLIITTAQQHFIRLRNHKRNTVKNKNQSSEYKPLLIFYKATFDKENMTFKGYLIRSF